MYTNNRYLGIMDNGQSRDIRIPEDLFTVAEYDAIKQTCKNWRDPKKELSIVSELFPVFSIASCSLPTDRALLLDIECRFPGVAKVEHAEPAQDMIDCLFLTSDGTLVFIEVKNTTNKEARGSGQSEPTVVSQLRRYTMQLGSEGLRDQIRDVYAGVINTLGEILGRPLPAPRTVFKSVPLLIVGSGSSPSSHGREVWQRKLLASPLSLCSDIIGIDGRNGRMGAALDSFFRAFASTPVMSQ